MGRGQMGGRRGGEGKCTEDDSKEWGRTRDGDELRHPLMDM